MIRDSMLSNERGFALIYVLSIVAALTILLSALVYACKVSVIIERQSLDHEQCYVVSRAVAGNIVRGLAAGKSVTAQSLTLAGLHVTIELTSTGTMRDVKVESKSITASDTISFSYDTISHRLDAWQDNGPGISE